MRTFAFVLLCLTNASLLGQDRIEEIGKSPVEMKFSSGGEVHMDLCSSGVFLKGVAEDRIRISYGSEHSSTDNVKVRLRAVGKRADINVHGCPHNNFEMTIEVPKSSGIHFHMFAGQTDISGIVGDKDVEMSAGQLTMNMGEVADYAHVDASVFSGELDVAPFNISKGGLFRSFHRSGPGKYRLHAHVGAGQVDLR